MLSTAEPLTKALDTLFRRKTVNVAAFANGDGPVSEISLGYFSTDHVKKHPEKSNNGFAVEHVVLMARALCRGSVEKVGVEPHPKRVGPAS